MDSRLHQFWLWQSVGGKLSGVRSHSIECGRVVVLPPGTWTLHLVRTRSDAVSMTRASIAAERRDAALGADTLRRYVGTRASTAAGRPDAASAPDALGRAGTDGHAL